MSGIAGIIRFDGGGVERQLLEGMTAAMEYRGPDGINHWRKGNVALGQCMLRTTPESIEEIQPLVSEDLTRILVMDGRIDNWEEMRTLLTDRGCRLRTRSDAELILKAYEEWGNNCLSYIDGDFAIALWDARRRELFCARDRIGAKPFHYHWDGQTLAFASDIGAILTLPWVKRKVNEGVIAEIIARDQCSLDETCWQGILRLAPAHCAAVDGMGLRPEKYWVPDLETELRYKRQEDYVEHYRELLFDVMRRYSRSNKPLACEVSGGLDSSGIFAVAEHLRRQDKFLAPGLDGYTLRFDDDTDANELVYARAMGEHLGHTIHEVDPTHKNLDWHRGFAQQYKVFPSAPNALMHKGIYMAAAKAGSSVLLNGLGGDEWLKGGPNIYSEFIAAGDFAAIAEYFAADITARGWASSLYAIPRFGVFPLLPESLKEHLRKLRNFSRSEEHKQITMMTKKMVTALNLQKSKCGQNTVPRSHGQRKKLQSGFLTHAFMARNRESIEHLAAVEGLELRAPLNSLPVIEFSLSTAEGRRLRAGMNKAIHREALSGVLPELVRCRRTKAEFSSAFQHFLMDLRETSDWSKPLIERGWADERELSSLLLQVDKPRDDGFVEFTLWQLFGCAAILTGYEDN